MYRTYVVSSTCPGPGADGPADLSCGWSREKKAARRGLEHIKEIKGSGCPAALFSGQRIQRLTAQVSRAHQSIPFIICMAQAASFVRFTPFVQISLVLACVWPWTAMM